MPTTYAIIQGNKYMDATTYSGTGAAANVTNAAGFYPDLTWVKNRSSGSYWNVLFDSVRGAGNQLSSNQTDAELASASNVAGKVSVFNSNGFGLAAGSSSILSVNGTSNNYVGWQWQAGQGTNVTNTTGTITSTVSANVTSGFSIVTWTGTGATGTIGHGLGTTPAFFMVKNRSTAATNWSAWLTGFASTEYLLPNLTDAKQTNGSTLIWSGTPTSSIINIGSSSQTNGSGNGLVAYCWAPISGFSAFGTYIGNGSNDGAFVYTGFRPKFILVKRIDATPEGWVLYDSSRNTYNLTNSSLAANSSGAEVSPDSGNNYDLLSNGFKARSSSGAATNANGINYLYAAWAETPFKYANAR